MHKAFLALVVGVACGGIPLAALPGGASGLPTKPGSVLVSASDAAIVRKISADSSPDAAAAPSAALIDPRSGAGALAEQTLAYAGVMRSFLVYAPPRLPTALVPLVIVMHGGSDDAATAASPSRATAAWRDLANLEKFIVVYANGVDRRWRDCRSDATRASTADDVGFIAALIDRLVAERAIDPRGVYVTGSSNGGMMAYRIGLELSTRIAGIGAVIANVPADPGGLCPSRPAAPLAVVIMNGTRDPLMPFAGGVVALRAANGTVRSAIATRDFWRAANGCSAGARIDTLGDHGAVVREIYRECSSGYPVTFFRIEGGGHDMPSQRYFSGAPRQNRDIEGAVEIWRALKDARR